MDAEANFQNRTQALAFGQQNPLSLQIPRLSDTMSDMKTVTLRSLRRDAALLDDAAAGEEILVTRFGKPYVRISPAKKSASFLGAGRHLKQKAAVSSEPIPRSEWIRLK
jgi:antitoxin (DNA-binding transcriptional repressor) of toxin-antitoxin stability system